MKIGKFGRHRFAEDDRAGLAQPTDRGCIGLRTTPCKNWRSALGRIIGGVENILDADRNAVQRADALAICLFAIEFASLLQCVLWIDMDKRVDLAVHCGNPLQAGGYIFLRRNHSARDFVRGFSCRKCGYVGLGQFAGFL